jgi:hypothetical protein
MSIAEARIQIRPAPAAAASWRPLGHDLWVGRTATGPVGVIERGRRFAATDADGRRRGTYASLDAAMEAFDAPATPHEAVHTRSWDALALVTTLAAAAGSLLAVYALIGI